MATYRFKIVGVHYAINPDSTSREEETELMHQRTAQRLRELDEKRPVVVLIPEPTNPVEERAVMARVEGVRIGYVSTAQLDTLHALFVASGVRILKATIESVEARKHGWMEVCVETEEEVRIEPQNQQDSPWMGWTSNLPELPVIDSRFAQMEAEVMLDDVLSKYPIFAPQSVTESHGVLLSNHPDGEEEKLCGTPCNSVVKEESVVNIEVIESYIRLWLESSLHDLSNEARLMREHYIMRLKEMMSQNATPSPKPLPRIRGLVFELEKQRTAICGQKRMNLRVGKWWKSLLASEEMGRLWKTWVARTDGNWEQVLTDLVTTLRALPFDLHVYIDDKKVFFSRLHYSQVPRKKYWQIISLMLLHERTLMEMKKEEEGGCNQTLLPCQDEETGNETFTVTIPQELETPEAKKVLARLQKKGILDEDLQPVKLSNTQKAVLAWELTERLRIKKRWAVMATLWKCNPETLRKSRDKGYDKNVSHEFEKFIKPIIHY